MEAILLDPKCQMPTCQRISCNRAEARDHQQAFVNMCVLVHVDAVSNISDFVLFLFKSLLKPDYCSPFKQTKTKKKTKKCVCRIEKQKIPLKYFIFDYPFSV